MRQVIGIAATVVSVIAATWLYSAGMLVTEMEVGRVVTRGEDWVSVENRHHISLHWEFVGPIAICFCVGLLCAVFPAGSKNSN